MSASEKLRALDLQIRSGQAWSVETLAVLPQIVAVVEAAEEFTSLTLTPGLLPFDQRVRDALSALEESLEVA